MKKGTFTALFIVLSATILILIHQYGNTQTFMTFSLIPILIAYMVGQFSERKFRDKGE